MKKTFIWASVAILAGGLLVAPSATTAQATAATCTTKIVANPSNTALAGYIVVPASASGSANCQRGPHGGVIQATRTLQVNIAECYPALNLGTAGPNRDGIDGVYGAKVIAAITAIQKAAGITKDGVYGKNTHNKMKFDYVPTNRVEKPCQPPVKI